MTNPFPSYQQPRKLERSRTYKMFGGVCGGLATYLNMDVTLVRVLTVIVSLFTGVPIILYLIALFVIPEEGADGPTSGYPPVNGPQSSSSQWSYGAYPTDQNQAGPVPPGPPSYAPSAGTAAQPGTGPVSSGDTVWGQEGAPWEQRQPPAAEPGASDSPDDKRA